MKKYAFYGREAYDLVYYLSLLLRQMGYRINLYDGTETGVFFSGLKTKNSISTSHYIAGIELSVALEERPFFLKNDKELCENQDFVFYISEEPRRGMTADGTFLVFGNMPAESEAVGRICEECGENTYIILKDCIHSLIDEDIFYQLYMPEWFPEDHVCGVAFDEEDYIAKVHLCYQLPRMLPELSKGFEDVLFRLAEFLTQEEKRMVRRAYKRGRRGSHEDSLF